jgi:hypothetical protein
MIDVRKGRCGRRVAGHHRWRRARAGESVHDRLVSPHRALRLIPIVTLVCNGACAIASAPPSDHIAAERESVTTTSLHGKRLDLHIALPTPLVHRDLLVVYASGDGGWFGTAVDQWRQIARAGHATAGFSARSFLRIDRPAGSSLNSARLANEYELIVQDAQRSLGWKDSPHVILAGWSRGAAFSVLVGTEPAFHDTLTGVVAMGLAEGEDLTVDNDDDTDDGSASASGRGWLFDTYARLLQLRAPCAVIQATHDNYFPAADARQRFGSDTATRRFYEVDAKNHRFSGGTAAFNSVLIDALNWLSSQ